MAAADSAVTPETGDADLSDSGSPGLVTPDEDANLTIRLNGRLDALRALGLRSRFDDLVVAAATRARGVVVDLSDVNFVDSAALAALVRLRRLCGVAGLELRFVKPRHADALRIFRLTQFDEVFGMLDGQSP